MLSDLPDPNCEMLSQSCNDPALYQERHYDDEGFYKLPSPFSMSRLFHSLFFLLFLIETRHFAHLMHHKIGNGAVYVQFFTVKFLIKANLF